VLWAFAAKLGLLRCKNQFDGAPKIVLEPGSLCGGVDSIWCVPLLATAERMSYDGHLECPAPCGEKLVWQCTKLEWTRAA
jgi:hypothetical protein